MANLTLSTRAATIVAFSKTWIYPSGHYSGLHILKENVFTCFGHMTGKSRDFNSQPYSKVFACVSLWFGCKFSQNGPK